MPNRTGTYIALHANGKKSALAERITAGSAHIIHILFKREGLQDAVDQFTHNNYPLGGGPGYYGREAYASWGVQIAA